jgi:hypothetical protein
MFTRGLTFGIRERNIHTMRMLKSTDPRLFYQAACKQAYHGITMTGQDYKNLLKHTKRCDIVMFDNNNDYVVGSVVNDVKFIPITDIILNKNAKIYYMLIPDDTEITIGGNSLIRTYMASKLIVKDIWISNDNHASDLTRKISKFSSEIID